MTSTAIRKPLLALAAVATVATAAPTRAPVRILDPLTGLRWSPATVAFAPLDASLKGRCPDLSSPNYEHELWVLARTGDLLVVSGRYLPRRAELKYTEGDLGAVVRFRPDGCAMIGPARDLFAGPADYAPDVSAKEAAALSTDAASRYVGAYRGAAGLCAAMRREGKRLAGLPETLRAPFRAKAPCLR